MAANTEMTHYIDFDKLRPPFATNVIVTCSSDTYDVEPVVGTLLEENGWYWIDAKTGEWLIEDQQPEAECWKWAPLPEQDVPGIPWPDDDEEDS